MEVDKILSHAKQNKVMYAMLAMILVISLVTMISASIAHDPVRRLDGASDEVKKAIEQSTGVGVTGIKNAKNASALIIAGQVIIIVAVLFAMVMGYKYADRVKSAISKSLAMRYF
jgi:hypothetical protein